MSEYRIQIDNVELLILVRKAVLFGALLALRIIVGVINIGVMKVKIRESLCDAAV
ncbi:MAG: hypothetical protein Q8R76_01090 [Candidatus Omnitrophota bacterium]|nr:hypothetical protein [Candidatus Omnitrophota bacterium]